MEECFFFWFCSVAGSRSGFGAHVSVNGNVNIIIINIVFSLGKPDFEFK